MKTHWQPVKRTAQWQTALDLSHGNEAKACRLMQTALWSVAMDGYDALRPRPRIIPPPGGFMLERERKAA